MGLLETLGGPLGLDAPADRGRGGWDRGGGACCGLAGWRRKAVGVGEPVWGFSGLGLVETFGGRLPGGLGPLLGRGFGLEGWPVWGSANWAWWRLLAGGCQVGWDRCGGRVCGLAGWRRKAVGVGWPARRSAGWACGDSWRAAGARCPGGPQRGWLAAEGGRGWLAGAGFSGSGLVEILGGPLPGWLAVDRA